ncbi:MAG: hypothetical protein QF662_09035, partial [Phycisphaerae bacterium]|jgi:hypothetical protein|nr:hypothetical protein [Phycisphaerae bacterium]
MIEQCGKLHLAGVDFQVADAEEYSAQEPADLIIASSSFQWFSDFGAVARRFAGWLSERGRVAFAVPVSGSLPELDASYRRAIGRTMPRTVFRLADDYRSDLTGAGLGFVLWQMERVVVEYRSAEDVLSALKGIGATGMSAGNGASPLLSRSELAALMEHYSASFRTAGGLVPCTYEVLYAVAEMGATR